MKNNSIGNDIIALKEINAERAGNAKFYSKFLSNSEVSIFHKNDFPFSLSTFTWLCWSIKESVYKYQKRLQPQLQFAPGKIDIVEIKLPANNDLNFIWDNNTIENNFIDSRFCYLSVAVTNEDRYYSHSFITNEFIYTVTSNEEAWCNTIYWGIKKIENAAPHNQSNEVRKFMLNKLNNLTGITHNEFEKTATGIPYIKQNPHMPVSLTHHQFFVAYVFLPIGVTIM